MKIVIDLTSLSDNFSGIERFALCITKELVSNVKTKDVEFILVFKNKIHYEFENQLKNVKKIIFYGGNKLIFNQVILPIKLMKIRADYYLFPAFPAPFFFFNKNSISAIHDLGCWDCSSTNKWYMTWYFKILYRKAARNNKRIITVSNFSKKRIMDILKVRQENILVVNNGMTDIFIKYKKNGYQDNAVKKYNLPSKYILCLSTLEPRKNLKLLISVYRELIINKDIDINLVLAGRKGWLVDHLLEGIEESVIDRITFTGFIDDNDLPYVYENAKLFVFPSIYEGFGIPPLEAMYMKTLVVASDSSSLPEILQDGAIYFKNCNFDDLKEKIVFALNLTKNEKNVIKERAYCIAKEYKWNKEADKIVEWISIK